MKRIILLAFILASLLQAKASDTLTLRQIYSFSVGDTFDYRAVTNNYDYQMFTTTYSRVIISQAYVSPGQDTFIYNGNWVITNLDSVAVYQDTLNAHVTLQLSFFDTSSYWGYNSNRVALGNDDGGTYTNYTDSLGITISGSTMASTANSGFYNNTYENRLIYFSNGHGRRFGTPYYRLAGVNDIVGATAIKIYPNPAASKIRLSVSVAVNQGEFNIIDMLGQSVYASGITESESTHDISQLSSGIYTWRLIQNNTILKTGKLVKE